MSDSEQEEENHTQVHGRDSPPRTQYEIMRDDGFTHLQDEEQYDNLATQRIKARPQRMGDNRPAENGIIESVECLNFMCHERLYVELGPLINFIVGENGSGKSAVLTALTLCLGGKASSTNRGGSLKSFVKEGRDHSVVIVAIKNTGIDAYQPETYGNVVKVERHFSKNGQSGFKLKSEFGRTISTKKADIDEITEYWGLQVDNPLNVLSQDNARQFLNAATAAQKYKFFYKGVQLEQLDHDYSFISETLSSHEVKLPEVREKVQKAQDDYNKALRDKDIADRNQTMRQEAQRLRSKLIWAQVVEQERLLAQREAEVARLEAKSTEDAEAVERATQSLEEHDRSVASTQARVEEASREKEAHEEVVGAATSKFQESKAALTDLYRQEREAHQELKTANQKVLSYEQEIESERAMIRDGAGHARQQILDKIAECEAKETEIETQLAQAADERPSLEAETRSAAEKAKVSGQSVTRQKQEIRDAENRIRSLRSNNRDALDPKIERLRAAIQRDNGFDRQPLGPIGSYIQLLKPDWSTILETTCGQLLNSFLVINKRDQQRLAQLMRQHNVQNTGIIIGKPLPSHVRLQEPDESYLTILRAMKIDDDWIRDQLVINQSIEKTILVDTREKGQEIMFSNSHPPPQHVIACLVPHDKKRGEGLRLTTRNGAPSTSPVAAWQQKPRMKSDAESQVLYQQKILEDLQDALRGLQSEHRDLETKASQCYEKQKRLEQSIPMHEKALRELQAKVLGLREELDKFEGVDDRLAGLQQSLKEAEDNRDYHGAQYGEMSVQKEALNKEVEAHKAQVQADKEHLRELEARLTKAEAKLKRAQDLRQVALVNKNAAYDAQEETSARKTRAAQECAQQAEVVATFVQDASQHVSERVQIRDDETSGQIEKLYDNVIKMLNERSKQAGFSDEDISRRLGETKDALAYWKDFYGAQMELHRAGKKSLSDRLKKWRTFQALISAHSRMSFQYLLSERGFRGSLLFDHEKRQLELSVEPDETRKSDAGRSTKTLSGGEKSFSSICMLLSIWEAMGSPLRCLDEFDVFMDNVNRTVSTNMLVGTIPLCKSTAEPVLLTLLLSGQRCSCLCFETVHHDHAKRHRGQGGPGQGCQDHSVCSVHIWHVFWLTNSHTD